MNACKKLFLVVMVMVSAVAVESETAWGDSGSSTDQSRCQISTYTRKRRADVRRSKKDNSSLKCGQNALCGTLDGTFDWVYGQVGIYYFNTDLKLNVFVPLYVKEAALSDDEYAIPYMIPKWDGKILWMNINPNKVPLGLQPFFLDDDPSCSGCMEFISRAMLYKQKGVDYSDYPFHAVRMYMYIKADADFRVKSYTIDVYDQDDNLAKQGVKLNIGDEIQSLYFEDDNDDATPYWNSVSIETATVVTQEPQFEYAGYIPGRDFGCTGCAGKIDLPQSDVFFRIVGYVHDTATDTDKPTYSGQQAMGKLRDNVCAAYPQQTIKTPELADIIEGLRILAALAPQHFCFRDVNGDNKFDMAEVIWMLQKIAGLR